MNVDFSTLVAALCHEFNGIVETAGDVLVHVILQVVALVHHTFVLVIVFTVVGRAINHVRNPNILEHFGIFGNQIAAQVQEVVNDLGTDALIELIFILFARSAPIVKIFIAELLWCDVMILDTLGVRLTWRHVKHATVTIALTLALTAWCAKLVLLTAPTHLMIWCLCRRASIA